MKCPQCNSTQTTKNGIAATDSVTSASSAVGNFSNQERPWAYSDDVKQLCLKMYLNGMGLRGIERVTEIHHTTVMHWLREAGHQLPDAPESEEIPALNRLG